MKVTEKVEMNPIDREKEYTDLFSLLYRLDNVTNDLDPGERNPNKKYLRGIKDFLLADTDRKKTIILDRCS